MSGPVTWRRLLLRLSWWVLPDSNGARIQVDMYILRDAFLSIGFLSAVGRVMTDCIIGGGGFISLNLARHRAELGRVIRTYGRASCGLVTVSQEAARRHD